MGGRCATGGSIGTPRMSARNCAEACGSCAGTKAASHDRILDIAAARIRRDGIDSLAVAELMKEAGLTHGGFYRHFDSREQLVGEATQRALSQGSAGAKTAAPLGGRRGYTALVKRS